MSPDEREQSIERLLQHTLKALPGGETGACLDAEVIAAWADGTLTGAALEDAQAHASACPRCRSIVSTLVRTSEAVSAATEKGPGRQWLAWLVPAAATAVAVAIWVAVNPRGTTPTPTSAEGDRQALRVETPAAPPIEQAPAPSPAATKNQPPPPSDARDTLAAKATGQAAPSAPAARNEATARAGGGAATGALAAAPPPPAAAPVAAPAEAAAQAPSRQTFRTPQGLQALAETVTTEVVTSPDPNARWRLAGATIEHSTDGGATWNTIFTGSAVLVAGSAPSATTCWIVGRGGTVLLSTDGSSFARLPFPEQVDLTSVDATNAGTASVSSADGIVWATADGGQRWEKR